MWFLSFLFSFKNFVPVKVKNRVRVRVSSRVRLRLGLGSGPELGSGFRVRLCDVPTTLLLYNCVFAYVNDKFTYFFVCALLFGFLMIEPLLR